MPKPGDGGHGATEQSVCFSASQADWPAKLDFISKEFVANPCPSIWQVSWSGSNDLATPELNPAARRLISVNHWLGRSYSP